LRRPSVLPDNEAVGRLAAEHLAGCGLASFAYCGTAAPSSAARWSGFQERLRALGHTCRQFDLDQPGRLSRWLAALPVPAGVFVFNDQRAAAVLAACRQAGRRVPDELAILGVDNDELLARLTDPPLSSVDTNSRQVGYRAAALLDRLMRGAKPPAKPVLVAPRCVVARRSTDILAVPDPVVRRTVSFIRQHSHEPLTIAAVIAQAHLSARQLQRRFKQTVGRTLEQELARARLDRACRLLLETPQGLEPVAEQAGFSNAKQMGATFRRLLHTTPTAYRRQS
jgi:LacI family transcriptional regulator